jgi:3-hydroxyisobutyrate dehydrogenase
LNQSVAEVLGGYNVASIAVIGLGNMGLSLASSLLAVGHQVSGYDLREIARSRLGNAGGRPCTDVPSAIAEADFVVTSLPDATALRRTWLEDPLTLKRLKRSAILIDCSTIGIEEARNIAAAIEVTGTAMLDAPVIGDPRDARARLLTFCVGGSLAAFSEAKPILEDMGERVIYVGKSGQGQAAVLCNELMMVVNLLGTAEAFALAERLGTPAEKLFEIASLSSGTSWSLIERCPQSGLVPDAPSNNMYQGGLASELILKHMRLLENAAGKADARAPLTTQAVDLFAEFCDTRDPRLDFSAVIQLLRRR